MLKPMCAIKQVKSHQVPVPRSLLNCIQPASILQSKDLVKHLIRSRSVARPFKKAKKSSRVEPVTLEFIILAHSYSLVLPKCKKRQQLMTEGRVKCIPIKRTMSPLQLCNAVVSSFNHLNVESWKQVVESW